MKLLPLFILLLTAFVAFTQNEFSHQDSLRGTVTLERSWWDVTYYHLTIDVNIKKKSLEGSNLIQYTVLSSHQIMQIELQEPLTITKIIQNDKLLSYKKDGYSYFIQLVDLQEKGDKNNVTIFYEGKPQESKNPPWSGGISWEKDNNKNSWVVTTCQGIGASIWWPNKDHASDEPDSLLISITAPKNLTAVANGKLRSVLEQKKTKTFNWFVANPINNYGVNMNIGDYSHFSETYKGLNGDLSCDYYVIPDNLAKAKQQFKEVARMLAAFEHWFGPYPFYEDGYKLVEVPYAGMEHQSSITYGNNFNNGYWGRDVSETGWGKKFDFIIVHESGHEWFANNITHKDVADMWIHEGFTSYSENLFVEYYFGKKAGSEYVIGTRKSILNDRPLIGVYNVHHEGSSDMYNKGANLLHHLRQVINNDEKWRTILTGLNQDFYHQTVTSKQIESYISKKVELDLTPFFNQYLRSIKIPILEYKKTPTKLEYRYQNVVENFKLPIKIMVDDKSVWITPNNNKWKAVKYEQDITFDENFYIEYKAYKPSFDKND